MHLRFRSVLSSLLMIPLTFPGALLAQTNNPPAAAPPTAGNRPTIGLVLQGGGALGLAHVGVITWLEEHHIPVSYVAGTSMGGLVGGVYATGRNAAELRDVVNGINWDQVMAGQTPFDDLSFRRKEDARDYPNNLEFGIRKGIQFPEGFNSGQQVSLILDQVALPYSEIKSFNDLPIPFACVATDLVSGRPKVFHDGSLSLALRSTMSLPGIFTPVRTKDAIYADGGLLQNIPVEVAKKMGADITLAVHLAEAPLPANANLSSFGVLGQSISVMISANELKSMESADLLISVPLQKYNALSFDKADEIIKLGYEAAAAKAKILLPLAVDDAAWNQYLAERASRRITTPPIPTFVAVDGVNGQLSARVQKQFAPVIGKPIDYSELDQAIMHLKGIGRFSTLSYEMVDRNGQQGSADQDGRECLWSAHRPAAHPGGRCEFEQRYVQPGRPGHISRCRRFSLGMAQRLHPLFRIRPEEPSITIPSLRSTHWFVAPRAFISDNPFYLYNENKLISIYRRDEGGGAVDVGYQFGTTGELRVGYEGGWQKFDPQIGNRNELPAFSGGYGETRVQYRLDRLDNAVIPRAGQALDAEFLWANASPEAPNQFPSLQVASRNFFRISEPSSVFLSAFAGSTLNYATGLPQFSLGGSQRSSHTARMNC